MPCAHSPHGDQDDVASCGFSWFAHQPVRRVTRRLRQNRGRVAQARFVGLRFFMKGRFALRPRAPYGPQGPSAYGRRAVAFGRRVALRPYGARARAAGLKSRSALRQLGVYWFHINRVRIIRDRIHAARAGERTNKWNRGKNVRLFRNHSGQTEPAARLVLSIFLSIRWVEKESGADTPSLPREFKLKMCPAPLTHHPFPSPGGRGRSKRTHL